MDLNLKDNEYIIRVELNTTKDATTLTIGNKVLDTTRTEVRKITDIIGTYTLNKVTHANFSK